MFPIHRTVESAESRHPAGWLAPWLNSASLASYMCLQVGAAQGSFPPTAVEAAYYTIYKSGGQASKEGWYFDESTKEFVQNEENGQTWPNCGGW